MQKEIKLRRNRIIKTVIQSLIYLIVTCFEIILLRSVLNIMNGLHYIENGNYLNINLLLVTIGFMVLFFNVIFFVITRNMKTDIYDLYCDNSIDQIEFRIHEFIRLRNDLSKNRGLSDKLILTVLDLSDSKAKKEQLVNYK